MKMFRRVRRCALHVSLFCALWTPIARAQSASFDPESPQLLLLPPPRAATVDQAGGEGSQRADMRRRDHLSMGALVGVGFPRPLAVEGVIKLERVVLLGAEYSALPSITVSGVQASCWAVAGDARVFPLHGPFFIGLRVGEQQISAEASVSAYGYTVPAALMVDTVFLNPRLGFLWTWDSGLTFGLDAGVQLPLSSGTSSTLPKSSSSVVAVAETSAQQSLESVAGVVGQTTLPTVDLLRIGILF
jgi:hypothetical protein